MPNTILTGIRANGELHFGHYLGVILPMLQTQSKLQSGDKMYMMIADLHSFITPIDHSQLYANVLQVAKICLASGLGINSANPASIFRQSFVPAHSELAWLLSCFTYTGEMSRMIQFKEKSQNSSASVGLFSYPILQAADVLLYDAEWVPVGEDQQQHLEIMRDIAIRINNKFESEIFILPQTLEKQLNFFELDKAVKIKSLANPNEKMSKSISDPKGTILLIDRPQDAAKKIMSATTDSLSNIKWDIENQPGITNLLQILLSLTGKTQAQIELEWTGKSNYGDLKKVVAQEVEKFLIQFQKKLDQVDPSIIEEVLASGEAAANLKSNMTLQRFQRILGLKKPAKAG